MNISNILNHAQWHSDYEGVSKHFSPTVEAIINNPSSLTQILRRITESKIKQQIHLSQWSLAQNVEIEKLQIAPLDKTWIRETTWQYRKEKWVATRAIIPKKSIDSEQGKILLTERKRSLGDLIFTDPQLKRSAFEFCLVTNNEDLMFARRSLLHFYQQPIFITEVFLPPFLAYLNL